MCKNSDMCMVRKQLNIMIRIQQGAFFSSDTSISSPTDGPSEHLEPLSVDSLLERIIDMMASDSASMNDSGRCDPPNRHHSTYLTPL